jgi:uncharacterized membrane protein
MMNSGARIFGHPIHPVLIVFPLGLLTAAVMFDVIRLFTGNPTWSQVAFYMIAAGVIGGLVAAVFGLIDWMAITSGTRAKSIGSRHGALNVLVVLLFIGSWWLRVPQPGEPTGLALALAFVGALLSFYTGWLGGELVFRHGVGVDQSTGSPDRT